MKAKAKMKKMKMVVIMMTKMMKNLFLLLTIKVKRFYYKSVSKRNSWVGDLV